jgi:hypothetical protein
VGESKNKWRAAASDQTIYLRGMTAILQTVKVCSRLEQRSPAAMLARIATSHNPIGWYST